ncbi:chorismate mutase Aro7 [Malassezia pachydermatis]
MHNAINFHNASVDDILSLDKIRASLQRMEESIVFRVIERAQYSHNARMYEEGAFPELREKEHWTGTWLMYLIQETESMYGTCVKLLTGSQARTMDGVCTRADLLMTGPMSTRSRPASTTRPPFCARWTTRKCCIHTM